MTPFQSWRQLEGTVLDGRVRIGPMLEANGGALYLAEGLDGSDLPAEVAVRLMREKPEDGPLLERYLEAIYLDHPNLLRCYGAGTFETPSSRYTYAVVDRYEDSLKHRIRQGALPIGEVRELGVCLAEALRYLHQLNLVCCSLDVSTVVRGDGRWQIADYSQLRVAGGKYSNETRRLLASSPSVPAGGFRGGGDACLGRLEPGLGDHRRSQRSAGRIAGWPAPAAAARVPGAVCDVDRGVPFFRSEKALLGRTTAGNPRPTRTGGSRDFSLALGGLGSAGDRARDYAGRSAGRARARSGGTPRSGTAAAVAGGGYRAERSNGAGTQGAARDALPSAAPTTTTAAEMEGMGCGGRCSRGGRADRRTHDAPACHECRAQTGAAAGRTRGGEAEPGGVRSGRRSAGRQHGRPFGGRNG